MKFYFDVINETIEMPFGKRIHGLQKNGRRPLICYLTIDEIHHPIDPKYLTGYLKMLRKSLHPTDGRIEIK